jgi:hypothetical protein
MKKQLFLTTVLAMGLAVPVQADPAVGFGLSFVFGGGGDVDTGLGVRITSDDEEDSVVATVGLDYMFKSKGWRPTVGAAYLGDNVYFGADLGFNFNGGGFDFGVGVGVIDTKKKSVAAAPPQQEDEGDYGYKEGEWMGEQLTIENSEFMGTTQPG